MMQREAKSGSIWRDFVKLGRLWPYFQGDRRLVYIAVALIPFIALIEVFIPITVRRSIDEGVAQSDWHMLMLLSGLYLGLVVLQYAVRSAQSLAAAFSVYRMLRKLRMKLMQHVLRLRCSYHDRSLSGGLVTRATSDFDNLSESLNTGILTSVIDFAVLIGSFAGLLYLNWVLALSALFILPVVLLIVNFFSKSLKVAMLRARSKVAELNAYVQECLYGNAAIKLLNAGTEVQTKHDRLVNEYRRAQLSSIFLDATMFSIIDGLTSITIGLLLYVAITSSGLPVTISAGVMVAFVQYIQQMFEPIKQLSNKIAMLQGAFTSMDRIFGILETREFVAGDFKPELSEGRVEFRNVSFAYQSQDQRASEPILENLSFVIEAHQSVALVGPTGSGKSTVLKLLTKLYDGWGGTITIDGHNTASMDDRWLRSQIAMVPQDIVLFDGSIAFNIGLGLKDISRADIRAAAERIGANRFIEELPGNYDFQVREQGSNLSHGMRQLIAFSRALVKRPKIIILDEATASVDPESEEIIQQGIASLIEGQTVIIVAHRLSTIENCDRIFVFGRGRLVESGSHRDLLQSGGAYAALHRSGLGS
jgi:ATP-binding cassette subfamily B multidrug efflux pump